MKGRMDTQQFPVISTPRLILRAWTDQDLDAFAEIQADPIVMQHFTMTMSRDETSQMLKRICEHFDKHGFGWWAAALKDTGRFIGYIGLSIPQYEMKFTPCVEVAWKLASDTWNQGLATEGASAALDYAFEVLKLKEVVSYTTLENHSSRRVMQKIGMIADPEYDFDHPKIPAGHRLCRHVFYRISQKAWLATRSGR